MKNIFMILFLFVESVNAQLWRETPETQAQKQAIAEASLNPLVEKALPATVVITTEAVIEQPALEFPGLPGPFKFFMPLPPEKQQGQASGFIINEDGMILTNHHVIDGAQKIFVTVGTNPRKFHAKIIGAEKELDVALIQIIQDSKEKIIWPYITLGDSDGLKLGDKVLAIGSPLGLTQSVSDGIVSQKHRGIDNRLFVELIQFTLGLNPGNSGGPVLDMGGRVCSIGQSIIKDGQSISFGVPINLVKKIMPQLHKYGRVEKSFLGIIAPENLTPQYAKALGLPQFEPGLIISKVDNNSPADKAGLKPMDVILEVDGKKVTDYFNLRQTTAYAGVGTTIELTIYRKGKGKIKVKAKLERRPDQAPIQAPAQAQAESSLDIKSVGIKVVSAKGGALVVSVLPGSPAHLKGIQSNDLIIEVDDHLITSAQKLKEIIDAANPGSALPTKIKRGEYLIFAPLEKPE